MFGVLCAPVALLCSAGGRLTTLDTDALGTSTFSFANLAQNAQSSFGSLKNNTCLGTADSLCPYQTLPLPGMPDQPIGFLLLYSLIFLILALAAFVGFVAEWRWLATKQYVVGALRRPRVAQYSVHVSGLPADADISSVAGHFNRLYSLDPKQPEPVSLALCRLRPRIPYSPETAGKFTTDKLQSSHRGALNPVHKVKNTKMNGRPELVGGWVADVQLITRNKHVLQMYQQMQNVKDERDEQQALQMKFADNSPEANSAASEAAMDMKADSDIILQRLDDKSKLLKYSSNVAGAFVTFNNEESWQRTVEDYQSSTGCASRLCQPKLLRFSQVAQDGAVLQGRAIRVEPADHPENADWIALTASSSDKLLRQVLFWSVVCVFILISLLLHGAAIDTVRDAVNLQVQPAVCTYLAPAAAARTLLFPDVFRLVRREDEACSAAGSARLVWEGDETPPPGQPKQFKEDPCFGGCLQADPASTEQLCNTEQFLAVNQTIHRQVLLNSNNGRYTQQDLVRCYCKEAMITLVNKYGVFEAFERASRNAATQGLCEDVAEAAAVLQGFGAGYGALLAVLMAAAAWAAPLLNSLLLHNSKAERQRSVFRTQILLGSMCVLLAPLLCLLQYDGLQGVTVPGANLFEVG